MSVRSTLLSFACMLSLMPPEAPAQPGSQTLDPVTTGSLVEMRVDWPEFLGRHDMIWEMMPTHFDIGPYIGNGMLGCTVYQDGPRRLRFEMGRADVTEHRRENGRLPIGGLVVETAGDITGADLRLHLWNAEISGTVTTTEGSIRFRGFVPADGMAVVLELHARDGERDSRPRWEQWPCVCPRNQQLYKGQGYPEDPPHPEPLRQVMEGVEVWTQRRASGGEFATAWQSSPMPEGGSRVILSIQDSFPGNTATAEALAEVQRVSARSTRTLEEAHRRRWHAFYSRNFVTLPDPVVESFYWIQWYTLGSAARSDWGPVDLLGPWFRPTRWCRVWLNMNIQCLYLPVYAGNHLELGESLLYFIDTHREQFFRNGREIWGVEGAAAVSHSADNQGRRGDGSAAPGHFMNPGDLTWVLHNVYLHYRHSMNHELVTDQERHAFVPLLRGVLTLFLHLVEREPDGTLQLPRLHSPEYGSARDTNYNLALFRWAATTLIELDARYNLQDPLVPRLHEVLRDLVATPVDETGLRIGSDLAVTKSHRHWSQMMIAHPLRIMDMEDPESRDLLRRSLEHWLTVDGVSQIYAWSRAAAVSLYAGLGDGEEALRQLYGHMSDARFVRPNTRYIEGEPVLESSTILNRSVQDMLLQSWGGLIRVFPAVPSDWADVRFHDMRAEGAFLVSTERREGRTRWVRLRSLAGEPCQLAHGFDELPTAIDAAGRPVEVTDVGDGRVELRLDAGDEVLLFTGERPAAVVSPLPASAEDAHFWGVKRTPRLVAPSAQRELLREPALSEGKTATASSVWSGPYGAPAAIDGRFNTRWAAGKEQIQAWLAVDLGEPAWVGRAVILQRQYPRIRSYRVEAEVEGQWTTLVEGGALDGFTALEFPAVLTRRVRLNVLDASDVPTVEEFRLLPPRMSND